MVKLAREIMERRVLTVSPRMSLAELEDFFMAKRITGAPVVEGQRVVGIVSRSDIVRALSLKRSLLGMAEDAQDELEFAPGEEESRRLPPAATHELEAKSVRDVMTVLPVSVSPETPVAEVARTLVDRHLHRVLVLEEGRLCGVISSLDLVRLIAEGEAGS